MNEEEPEEKGWIYIYILYIYKNVHEVIIQHLNLEGVVKICLIVVFRKKTSVQGLSIPIKSVYI